MTFHSPGKSLQEAGSTSFKKKSIGFDGMVLDATLSDIYIQFLKIEIRRGYLTSEQRRGFRYL